MSEVDSQPLGGIRDVQPGCADSLSRRLILRGPSEDVVILSIAKMEEAAHRSKKLQCRIERILNGGGKYRVRRGPAMLFFHFRHKGEPTGQGVIPITSKTVLHVRFEVKDSVPEFAVARPRNIRQVSHEDLRLLRHHFRNQTVP